MRILILGHNYAPEVTGIAPYTTELAEHFANGGHSVTVLTTFPHYPRYRWQERPSLFREERLAGVSVRRTRVVLPRQPTAVWRIVFDSSVGLACLASSVGVARPDLILAIVPTLQSGFAAGLLSKWWRVPAVLLVKDLPLEAGLAVGMLKPGALYKVGTAFERLVYRMVDRVVVIGEQFRGNLLAKGVRAEAITVIPDWVDLDRIRPLKPEAAVRNHLAGSDVGFLVLHAGAMAEKQGLSIAVDAAKRLADDPSTVTVLVGDGPNRPYIEAAIKERRLINIRVLDIQPADYLPKMLAAADVLLLTQRAGVVEAVVPSKLLHYMAAGRPVIAAVSAGSVAATLITTAACGLVVPPEDPIRLAEAIRDLQRNPELRMRLGRHGREFAEASFNKSAILGRWDNFVSDTVSNTRVKHGA